MREPNLPRTDNDNNWDGVSKVQRVPRVNALRVGFFDELNQNGYSTSVTLCPDINCHSSALCPYPILP